MSHAGNLFTFARIVFFRNCLRDISPQRLQRILKILDYVNETQMMVSSYFAYFNIKSMKLIVLF